MFAAIVLIILCMPVTSFAADDSSFEDALASAEISYESQLANDVIQKQASDSNDKGTSNAESIEESKYRIWSQVYVNDANNQLWTVIVLSVLCMLALLLVTYAMKRFHLEKVLFDAIGLTLIIFSTVILVIVSLQILLQKVIRLDTVLEIEVKEVFL